MNHLYNSYKYLYQKIFDINSKIDISFEFFPPKIFNKENNNFLSSIKKLSIFHPNFISITCTPRNSEINYTYQAIKNIPKTLNLNIAPHITYINNINTITKLSKKYWNNGIKSIVALRGDVISKEYNSEVYAFQLVTLLKKIADFDISVAAYPEVHPEAKNANLDLIHLKEKINCGANRAITQFFFDVNKYLKFRDRCISIGINVDIIPGILPIMNFQQLKKFINLTNVYVPSWINNIFNNININNIHINKMIGLVICVDIIQKLCKEGVNKFHFYTLNDFEIVYTLCSILKQNIKIN
ncbi:methylenetetrahydrofolate reductase [Buchnera aphidicola]|uniref:Methylenetetrahydrofolate reductase n=1 Tax=Buchnera aphidicola (Therioaphis trifolii) TaxID=1241884 RepID=A0A4D6YAP1_9GAMM|nr:methylenetetrahydrofolate reductase [Buchnera aphidicola]QCI27046.1 5,10-methylenetetrahydrofolate reductase [Buchnera aphidicola (Therioaphis trifolii)]